MSDSIDSAPNKEIAGANLKLDASVRLIPPQNNLLAFASVKIEDCFVVDNIKVCTGEKGLFVDMPSAKDKEGKYHDICFPITAAFRERLNNTVLDGYAAAVEKNQNIAKAQQPFVDKPPISGRLEANKARAAERNASRPAPATERQKSAAAR